jgi:hypothetical protein
MMAQAPTNATLVVFHTAALGYVASATDRESVVDTMARSGAVWISNEAAGVFPAVAKLAPPSPAPGRFLLAIDGPHGQSIDWFVS